MSDDRRGSLIHFGASAVGTAVVGTLIALLLTTQLPDGTWSDSLVVSFFAGERIPYAVLAVVVGVVAGWGALTLTDSHTVEEHPIEAEEVGQVVAEPVDVPDRQFQS